MLGRLLAKYPVYLACREVDMRKSINGLAAIVQGSFEMNPYAGALFVFTNTKRDKIKVLKWDKDGFVLYYKRREKGRFVWPAKLAGDTVRVSKEDLYRLLDGLVMEAFVPKRDYTVI